MVFQSYGDQALNGHTDTFQMHELETTFRNIGQNLSFQYWFQNTKTNELLYIG